MPIDNRAKILVKTVVPGVPRPHHAGSRGREVWHVPSCSPAVATPRRVWAAVDRHYEQRLRPFLLELVTMPVERGRRG